MSTTPSFDRPDSKNQTPRRLLRVLHLGAGNLFGGIEVNLVTLARSRQGRPDLEAEYGFCFDGKPADELRNLGVAVPILGAARFSRPWTVLAARRRLAALLRRSRYDCVICHETWVHALFGPVARRAKTKLVFWAHDRHNASRGLIGWLAWRTRPDKVICNSQYSAAAIPRVFPGVECEVVYCPVSPVPMPSNLDRRSELRQRFDTPSDAVVVVQVGRWDPYKGHLAHIQALAGLKDLPGWVCWQVGAPQRPSEERYQQAVKEAAARHGIADRIRFLGWQGHSDLGGVLAAADIYCQPNIRPEPFGITIVEALYAGLPVIASDEAGPKEIVTGSCGVLVPPSDIETLAGALRRLLIDPARRKELGAAGPTRAAEICWPEQQVGRLADCLASIRS